MAALQGAIPQQQQKFRVSLPITIPMMDPPLHPRPTSALARGVKITEFKDNQVNPEPIVVEESDLLLEEYLSPRKLRDLTGHEDLTEVHYMEMRVDTRDTSLGNFGAHLPNLSQLKLSNSIISSARDLGSCLSDVKVLWMARCGLEDIDGISSLSSLKELYLAYNEISDISPCSMLESLQILDLEGNNIDEISQIEFLNICSKLSNLTLEGNPVCVTPSPDQAAPDYNYQHAVKRAVPHLRYLDDEVLVEQDAEPRRTASAFDDDWKLIDELMQEGAMTGSEDSLEGGSSGRPGTSLRPTTGYRPGSALKPYTATGVRPGTRGLGTARSGARPGTSTRPGSGGRPQSALRPGTAARPGSTDEADSTEDVSDLTTGGVVCGNPSKALRARQQPAARTQHSNAAKLLAQYKHKPEHTYDTALEDDDKLKGLLQELKDWKNEHHKRVKVIETSKEAQVLKIDHDDAVSLSDGDQESISSDEGEDEDEDVEAWYASRASIPSRTTEFFRGGAQAAAEPNDRDVRPKSRADAPSRPSPPVAPHPPHAVPRNSVQVASRRRRLQHDESFDTPQDDGTVTTPEREDAPPVGAAHTRPSSRGKSLSVDDIHRPTPLVLRPEDIDRPHSGPVVGTKGKFRLEPVVDKTGAKDIDRSNPVVRMSVHSPEKLMPDGLRATTSRAALGGQPASTHTTKIRKGKLANVPLLPSKPATFSK